VKYNGSLAVCNHLLEFHNRFAESFLILQVSHFSESLVSANLILSKFGCVGIGKKDVFLQRTSFHLPSPRRPRVAQAQVELPELDTGFLAGDRVFGESPKLCDTSLQIVPVGQE
jgi:hypothetical protein